MDGSDAPPPRDVHGRFAAGGRGRPFGSRNRVSKRVARAILHDFEANQAELLPRLRRWYPAQYLALIGRLLPRVDEAGGPDLDALDALEMARIVENLRAAMARMDAGNGSLADLEAALLGEEEDGATAGATIWAP